MKLSHVLIILVAALGIFLYQIWPRSLSRGEVPAALTNLGQFKEKLPESGRVNNQYQWGRYRRGLERLDFHFDPTYGRYIKLKQWHYHSVYCQKEQLFVAFAVANLQYIANAFVYVVDLSETHHTYEFTTLSPFALNVKRISDQSSYDGCTLYESDKNTISICFEDGKFNVAIDVVLTSKKQSSLQTHLTTAMRFDGEQGESLAMLFPLEIDEPAYTHKQATMPTVVEHLTLTKLSDDSVLHSFDNVSALGALDWTCAMAKTNTIWKWAAFSHTLNTTTIGINLSDRVYNAKDTDISQESGVWFDGKVYLLDAKLEWVIPSSSQQLSQMWSVCTKDENAEVTIDLTFTPISSREEHVNAIAIVSDFVQVAGYFHGKIGIFDKSIVIDQAFGVMEDHYAIW